MENIPLSQEQIDWLTTHEGQFFLMKLGFINDELNGQVSIVWEAEDLEGFFHAVKQPYTHEDAMNILRYARDNHNPEYGIDFDTMMEATAHYFENNKNFNE